MGSQKIWLKEIISVWGLYTILIEEDKEEEESKITFGEHIGDWMEGMIVL
jgi:hypothetical protein